MGAKYPPRKCKRGAPAWLVTFGDMMALLLTFFVLLLSFAQLDIVKFEEASGSLKDAFGIQRLQQINPMPTGETMIAVEFQQQIILIHLKDQLDSVLVNKVDSGEAEVLELDEGFLVRLANESLFKSGTVVLSDEAELMLQQIANLLVEAPNLIHIASHTDDQPATAKGGFPNNWALTAAQAAAVTAFFAEEGGVDPTRLQARAFAQFSPKDSNQTEAGRAHNRRIEIMISRVAQPSVVDPLMGSTRIIETSEPPPLGAVGNPAIP